MSLSGAAAAMGLPESLVQRSAEARAAETGQSVDDILAAWAGGETVEAPSAPQDEPAAPEEKADETAEEEPSALEPVVDVPTVTPVAEPAAATLPPSRAPLPAEVTEAQAANLPEVVTVPTAGITERTNFSIPKWLTGLLIVVPLVALFALGGSATGTCGEATELTTNIITGEIVNCDGSEFTGSGAGGGGENFVAAGEDIYSGAGVAGVNCSSCHGANGQGSGAFPALTGVGTTFSACTDHIEWVSLGTGGWPEGTYGDTNKPVGGAGQMPAFAGTLTEEQIASVVAFERVRFGGLDEETVLIDCGLAQPEGEEGEGATGTTAPAEGEGEASLGSNS